jgi:hypothetical protein
VDDPSLVSELQLASRGSPIVDDLEGALAAAASALRGFRELNEPFVALAALSVGMLEMSLGRDSAARPLLLEVKELGERFGNTWLTSTARTQLASLAVRAGLLDQARELLIETVDSVESSNVSTLTVTFALVAPAHLALAEGDALQAATCSERSTAADLPACSRGAPRRGEMT